jgi:serine/threonine-protein kinase
MNAHDHCGTGPVSLPAPGEIVAERYAIVREAGRGGMSVVFEAADLKLGGKRRALKAMKPGTPWADDGGAGELHVLQRIDHPRLPQVIDVIPPSGGKPLMLVTDYVHGEPLAKAFARAGRKMDARQALTIAIEVCEALAYLHELRPPVIHLDVKPSNVMLDPALGVRLIDFGIARLLGGRSAGRRLGTPGFAAPEQAAGSPCGPAADVYAAGALLYFLLSGGHAPKPGEHRFRQLPASVPEPALDVMARLLSRDPARRPTARRAAALLRQAAGGSAALSGPHAGADGAHAPAGRSQARPLLVGAASFSRGAGATLLAAMLAELLARSRPTALVEAHGGEPELLALLAGADAVRQPGRPAPPPVSRRHVCWLAGPRLQVHALHPDPAGPAANAEPHGNPDGAADAALAMFAPERFVFPETSAAEPPLVIADLSSGWTAGGARQLAAACDVLLMIADPAVWRWTPLRQSAWRGLARQREAAGYASVWIANQDARFPQRSAWLRLMPQSPAVCVPQLAPGDWQAAFWSGRPLSGNGKLLAAAERGLRPVIELILNG